VGGPPGAAGRGPDHAEAPAPRPGRPGLPGVSGCVSSLFGTRSAGWCWPGCTDPARLASLGGPASSSSPPAEGPGPGPVPERLVAAAPVAIQPTGPDRPRHHRPRPHLGGRLGRPDRRGRQAPGHPAATQTPFAVLCSGLGWRVVRAATYGAAVGDPARWPSPRQLYRASGLCPATTPRLAAATTAPSAAKAR
jgi:transposase